MYYVSTAKDNLRQRVCGSYFYFIFYEPKLLAVIPLKEQIYNLGPAGV